LLSIINLENIISIPIPSNTFSKYFLELFDKVDSRVLFVMNNLQKYIESDKLPLTKQ
jgi:hypothetical protein